ncbi:MAG: aldehyde ferredoxin oxidoreductase family protein [Candidatus Helarchaeota archaeon]
MTIKGYAGKIAHIDLKEEIVKEKLIGDDLALEFLGGRGFIAKILWDELLPKTDPWSPSNIFIVANGILTGHTVPAANRTIFGTKSPHTGGYADSMMGGYFSPQIKFAGYDMLIFKNQANHPVYILVTDDGISIEDASTLWGKGTIETEKLLKAKYSDKHQVASIGPASERGVNYACITHAEGRNASREGVGAIMGNKKIKAIIAKGSKRPQVNNPELLKDLNKRAVKEIRSHQFFDAFHKWGTTNVVEWCHNFAVLPNKNFQYGSYDDWIKISGQTQRKKTLVKDGTCWGCPIGCWMIIEMKKYGGIKSHFTEYETTGMIGSNLELKDVQDLQYANYLCNDFGVDTISTGSTIAFAIECYQKGIISLKETDGLELKFGDANLIFKLIEKIAKKDGFGALLARGTAFLAKKWGNQSINFAMQVKNNETSAYDSRMAPAMALSFMTADVGAHHNRSWAVMDDIKMGRDKLEGKPELVIDLQHKRPLLDQLGVCRFPWVETDMNYDYYAKFYTAITGIEITTEELLKKAEKVWNLTRCFWFREVSGFGRSWDLPPKRWTEPMDKGPTKGQALKMEDYNKLLDTYYELRGWDSNGKPRPEKIKELKLDFVLTALDF